MSFESYLLTSEAVFSYGYQNSINTLHSASY